MSFNAADKSLSYKKILSLAFIKLKKTKIINDAYPRIWSVECETNRQAQLYVVAREKGCFVLQSNHLQCLKSQFKESKKFQTCVLMRIALWPLRIKAELIFCSL